VVIAHADADPTKPAPRPNKRRRSQKRPVDRCTPARFARRRWRGGWRRRRTTSGPRSTRRGGRAKRRRPIGVTGLLRSAEKGSGKMARRGGRSRKHTNNELNMPETTATKYGMQTPQGALSDYALWWSRWRAQQVQHDKGTGEGWERCTAKPKTSPAGAAAEGSGRLSVTVSRILEASNIRRSAR